MRQPLGEALLLAEAGARAEAVGRTSIAIAVDGRACAVVVVTDTVRPTSRAAVAELRRLGLRTLLLTGDNRRTASAVADEVAATAPLASRLTKRALAGGGPAPSSPT